MGLPKKSPAGLRSNDPGQFAKRDDRAASTNAESTADTMEICESGSGKT